MAKERILVIEDEPDILELITFNLKSQGYQIEGYTTAEQGLRKLPTFQPRLVVLDWMLPGMDGIEFCKLLRQKANTAGIRILLLTARNEETDMITGLELGADDYMTKPFSTRVLLARVRALLRREQGPAVGGEAPLEVEGLYIHPGKREVKIDETPVRLTNMEFRILYFLASHQGWVYSRSQIVTAARGEDYAVTDRSVDAIIVGLRKKLGDQSHLIETVRGVGYRFKE